MIEFNLLPTTKTEYVRAEKTKLLIGSISLIVSVLSVAVLALLVYYVDIVQKNSINKLSTNISNGVTKLNSYPNLDKILTIQNQANLLPTIQHQLFQPSRIFTYLSQLTPFNATISSLDQDLTKNTITISGNVDSIQTTNKFVDTLKYTTYSILSKSQGKAFSDIVLSAFDKTSYTITLTYQPAIFLATNNVSLIVPNITTTRSVLDQPTDLFKKGK